MRRLLARLLRRMHKCSFAYRKCSVHDHDDPGREQYTLRMMRAGVLVYRNHGCDDAWVCACGIRMHDGAREPVFPSMRVVRLP